MAFFTDLPSELVFYIAGLLCVADALRLARACKYFHAALLAEPYTRERVYAGAGVLRCVGARQWGAARRAGVFEGRAVEVAFRNGAPFDFLRTVRFLDGPDQDRWVQLCLQYDRVDALRASERLLYLFDWIGVATVAKGAVKYSAVKCFVWVYEHGKLDSSARMQFLQALGGYGSGAMMVKLTDCGFFSDIDIAEKVIRYALSRGNDRAAVDELLARTRVRERLRPQWAHGLVRHGVRDLLEEMLTQGVLTEIQVVRYTIFCKNDEMFEWIAPRVPESQWRKLFTLAVDQRSAKIASAIFAMSSTARVTWNSLRLACGAGEFVSLEAQLKVYKYQRVPPMLVHAIRQDDARMLAVLLADDRSTSEVGVNKVKLALLDRAGRRLPVSIFPLLMRAGLWDISDLFARVAGKVTQDLHEIVSMPEFKLTPSNAVPTLTAVANTGDGRTFKYLLGRVPDDAPAGADAKAMYALAKAAAKCGVFDDLWRVARLRPPLVGLPVAQVRRLARGPLLAGLREKIPELLGKNWRNT